jgi:hypothetical protein
MKREGDCFSKKGQVTVFIIVAVILAAIIGVFFIFNSTNLINVGFRGEASTNAFFQSCLDERIQSAVNDLSKRGGSFGDLPVVEFRFAGEEYTNITYLCYNQGAYTPCVNQVGLLMPHMEGEIKNQVESDTRDCFDSMVENFRGQGYEVSPSSKFNDFKVILSPNFVTVQTDSELTLTRSDETTTEQNFKADYRTGFYDTLLVAQEIINQETISCYFDVHGFSLLYPRFDIKRLDIDNLLGSMYVVENTESDESFRFAIRSCIIPAF